MGFTWDWFHFSHLKQKLCINSLDVDIKLYFEAITNSVFENVKRSARIGDKQGTHEGVKKTGSRYEGIVKVIVKKDLKKMDWIYLAQDRDQWLGDANTVVCK